MSEPLPLIPPRSGPPPTLEAQALFRVKTAALSTPAAPPKADPDMIWMAGADGGVVVYGPSAKLVILAAARERLRPAQS